MYIGDIIEKSKVNGPGTRFTIWVQGCSIHCKGCANKHLWEPGVGRLVTPQELHKMVLEQKDIDGISISGGEPLEQYDDLVVFLELCKSDGIEVFLTSGYTLDTIKKKFPKILNLVDILIDGPFMQDRIDSSPAWRGSLNQGINLLTKRAKKYKNYKPEFTTEMVFGEGGDALITGFSVPDFIKGV